MLSLQASIHLIISMIFNQGIKSSNAFSAPKELLNRLHMQQFDLPQMEQNGYDALQAAIAQKPCLHRFTKTMTNNLFSSITTLNRNFSSDPRLIWSGKSDEEVVSELMKLRGIGRHKAIQCLIMLHYMKETPHVSDSYYAYIAKTCNHFLENISVDVQSILKYQ